MEEPASRPDFRADPWPALHGVIFFFLSLLPQRASCPSPAVFETLTATIDSVPRPSPPQIHPPFPPMPAHVFSFRLFTLHALGNSFDAPTTATDSNNVHPREVWFFLRCTCERLPSLVDDVYDSLAFPSLSTFRARAIQTFPAPPQLLCTSQSPTPPVPLLIALPLQSFSFSRRVRSIFPDGPQAHCVYFTPHFITLYWDKMIIVLISEQLVTSETGGRKVDVVIISIPRQLILCRLETQAHPPL